MPAKIDLELSMKDVQCIRFRATNRVPFDFFSSDAGTCVLFMDSAPEMRSLKNATRRRAAPRISTCVQILRSRLDQMNCRVRCQFVYMAVTVGLPFFLTSDHLVGNENTDYLYIPEFNWWRRSRYDIRDNCF